MDDDPYAALGVKKTATEAEIKKAYRKLVRTSHPDINPDDPGAEARFVKASAAYELLKDPATRARYDAGEIDASGAEKPQRRFYRDFAEAPGGAGAGRGFEGVDPSDIFAEILRQRGRGGFGSGPGGGFDPGEPGFRAQGADQRYALEVSFLDAVRGARTRVTLPGGNDLEVAIPPGLRDGQTLRLRGKGGAGYGGGPAGDAYVTVSVRPHPVFRRDGDDIVVSLPIAIDEAVLGARVEAPTIDGPVTLTIPRGANTGQVLRLRGRGVKRARGAAGDQRVELKIVAPPKSDPDLARFLDEWRKSHAYDPRRELMKGAAQ
jgi:DnaJ-class molecular chaperone